MKCKCKVLKHLAVSSEVTRKVSGCVLDNQPRYLIDSSCCADVQSHDRYYSAAIDNLLDIHPVNKPWFMAINFYSLDVPSSMSCGLGPRSQRWRHDTECYIRIPDRPVVNAGRMLQHVKQVCDGSVVQICWSMRFNDRHRNFTSCILLAVIPLRRQRCKH